MGYLAIGISLIGFGFTLNLLRRIMATLADLQQAQADFINDVSGILDAIKTEVDVLVAAVAAGTPPDTQPLIDALNAGKASVDAKAAAIAAEAPQPVTTDVPAVDANTDGA